MHKRYCVYNTYIKKPTALNKIEITTRIQTKNWAENANKKG
jgi:hypothetical protein